MTCTHQARNKVSALRTHIGNFNHSGGEYLVKAVKRAIAEHGRIALFAAQNGEVAAYAWRHIDYDRHCRVHASRLVGIYQAKPDGERFTQADLDAMEQDLICHITSLGAQRKAA